MKTRFFTKTQEYEGAPKLSDFKIVEKDIDENIEDGGALVHTFIEVFGFTFCLILHVQNVVK